MNALQKTKKFSGVIFPYNVPKVSTPIGSTWEAGVKHLQEQAVQ